MLILQKEEHRLNKPCFCSKCVAYRKARYNEVAVRELSDKLQTARTNQLGADDPRCRLDDCIRIVLSQIDKKP